MNTDFRQLAINALSGEWQYDVDAKSLKKYLGDLDRFKALAVIGDDQCLDDRFKQSILDLLAKHLVITLVGPE